MQSLNPHFVCILIILFYVADCPNGLFSIEKEIRLEQCSLCISQMTSRKWNGHITRTSIYSRLYSKQTSRTFCRSLRILSEVKQVRRASDPVTCDDYRTAFSLELVLLIIKVQMQHLCVGNIALCNEDYSGLSQ